MTRVFNVPLRWHGGGTDTEQESAHKVNSGKENFPTAPAGIQTHNLSITSIALLPTFAYAFVIIRKMTIWNFKKRTQIAFQSA